MKKKISWLIATWFGSGLSPIMPGTAGSLAALPFAYFIQVYLGYHALFIASIAIFFIGWWATNEYLKNTPSPGGAEAGILKPSPSGRGLGEGPFSVTEQGEAPTPALFQREKHGDPGEIVVDEVAGQWLTLACIASLYPMGVSYVTGFILFRIFDIIKIWPASWADNKVDGGLGVMLDDIFAALQGALVVWIFHTVMG